MTTNHQDEVQDLLHKLQAPVENVTVLLAYLTAPLDNIRLLPPVYRKYNVAPLAPGTVKIARHIPQFQRILLQHIVPTWDSLLAEKKASVLLDQYFCPDLFSNASPAAGEIAVIAYSVLLSSTLTAYGMRILERLAAEYPVDRLYVELLSRRDLDGQAKEMAWNDCVRDLAMVPTKVANAVGMEGTILPGLQNSTYFNNMASRCERLISSLANSKGSRDSIQYLTYLLGKLVNIGLFPPSPPTSRTQPSFFQTTLPTIRSKSHSPDAWSYFSYWNELMANLPSSLTLQSILVSLFAALCTIDPPWDNSATSRGRVREEALLLSCLVGHLEPAKDELWETALSLIIKRNWDESYARIFVCWISGAAQGGPLSVEALDAFMQSVLELWSSPEYVKHSLLSQHRYTTTLLLVTASYFRPNSPPLQALSFSTPFIRGITTYLSHQDSSIRHCGMLVGEEIARMCNKKLDFGGWDGDDSGKPWARSLRHLIQARDVDADIEKLEAAPRTGEDGQEIEQLTTPGVRLTSVEDEPEEPVKVQFKNTTEGYDSDDSLTGYESPPSSRSASPTPSELAEIEHDPSLNVGVKKVARPVYLKQLGDLLRGGGAKTSPDDPHEADKIEMGLNCAEELIRKKRDFGTELAENAVNLEYALISLNDNYELQDFSAKRQGALNALAACAPRQATPALIEEFFKNQYSTDQRFVILNALAMGARELASLPIPESRVPVARIAFPSKTLPGPLHQKYITARKADRELVPLLMDDISRKALEQQKEPSAGKDPLLVREKILRIKRPPGVSEVSRRQEMPIEHQLKRTTFTEVAAEFFIAPLINRFWLFLREEQMREERTSHLAGRQRYHGAGTGLILNALVLSHFLRTLAILVNASQNAPEWLAILAPDALELAITVGTRPMTAAETEENDDDDDDEGKQGKEAAVLTSALELVLVVLDGSINVDGGRTLGLEHTSLLLGSGEWAGKIFENLEKGLKVEGGGGVHEVRLRRAAAGVLLKVDELTSRWKRSMLDFR